MTEIKRDPICSQDENGDELVTFDPDHTLSDIARWICRNKSDAEEVHRMIGEITRVGAKA